LANKIKESQKFKAIVLNTDGGIIDGHHRFEAAKLLKMKTVPAQYVKFQED
jgi:ParB-like chromosome segregation protein Spo0J